MLLLFQDVYQNGAKLEDLNNFNLEEKGIDISTEQSCIFCFN